MIIKLDEGALLAAGLSKEFVQVLRHLVAQIGTATGGTTLPELADQTDTLTPIVTGLVITLTATNVLVSELEANQADLPRSDNHLVRRLDDLEAQLEVARIERTRLSLAVEELQANTDTQSLNIADIRRRTSQLEDAQT